MEVQRYCVISTGIPSKYTIVDFYMGLLFVLKQHTNSVDTVASAVAG